MGADIPFIDLKAQYEHLRPRIREAMDRVLDSGQFILGPEVTALEEELKARTSAPHAISCGSGTDALLLALLALEVGPGDEVVVPAFTFIAPAEVVALLGATPVFVDVCPATYNLRPQEVKAALTSKSRAIIAVSLFGLPPDMPGLQSVADEAGVALIEDAAQSFGAQIREKQSGNLSALAATSFFPAKPLGAYGDGGAVFAQDDDLALKIEQLRVHGQTKRYEHGLIGLNARMDALQAAILRVKLDVYDEELAQRRTLASRYDEGLRGNDELILPTVPNGRSSVYAQYSIRVRNRDEVIGKLNSQGIPVAVHYPAPVPLQPCFANRGHGEADFPVSVEISRTVLSLPFSAYLKSADQDRVIDALLAAV